MVVGQLLITPTIEICIQQLGRVEEGMITTWCDMEHSACTEPLRRADLSAAETLVLHTVVAVTASTSLDF